MAGFLDPVRPVEQGPGWNWNPGQTFVTAFNDAKKQQALLEKNRLDMEMEQILMPYKVQKAALDLDKLQAETEYLAGHTELQRAQTQQKREMLNGLNATRKSLLNLQNRQIVPGASVGESLLDEPDVPVSESGTTPSAQADPYLPKVAPSSSESSLGAASPTDAELDQRVAAMPNSDNQVASAPSPRDLSSDPNGFTSPDAPANPLTDSASEDRRVADLFSSLPAPGATTADNASGVTPTDVAGMEKNNAAMDAAKKPEPTLDRIAKSLPASEKPPADGLTSFVKGYRSLRSEYGQLAASAANNPDALREVKNTWKAKDLELRSQAEGLYGIPAVEGRGVFQSLVSASDPTLSEIQKLKDRTGSWETAIKSAFTAPKAEKASKPNEELNSLVYARKELASSLGETPTPEAKANLDRLDQQIQMVQRGITPDQAQQEKVTASRSYQLGEISKWIGGAEPEKKSALMNLNSLIEKGEIPTISLKQNKDGKMLYSKADQALLSKVEDGMPFAAVDASGTRQILRKDSNSGFGFSRWGKLGSETATSATPSSASPVSVSDANPLKESLQQIEQSKLVKSQAKEDEELADIERRMSFLSQAAAPPSLSNPAAWGSQLVRGIAPESTTKNLSDTWEKLNSRKKQLLAAKATRTGK